MNERKERLKSSKRQLATVIDLNKCMGCQTCTVACKSLWTGDEGMGHMRWMSVSTLPGAGYPRNAEKKGGGYDQNGKLRKGELTNRADCGDEFQFNHNDVFYQGKGQSERLEPRDHEGNQPQWGYNWDEDQGSGQWPNPYFFYLPMMCMHCSNAPCVDACSRDALSKNVDGIVLLNPDLCNGYRHCVEACPYKMTVFNPVQQKSEKCIMCFPRLEKNIAPACNRQCPGRTRAFGYLDDQAGQVYKLVRKWKVALPLHPEYGTEPNVYYVPPLSPRAFAEDGSLTDEERIPLEVLEGYFGPEVKRCLDTIRREREKVKNGGRSELIDLLISRTWKDRFGQFTEDPI